MDEWMGSKNDEEEGEERKQRMQGRKRNCIDSRFEVCVFSVSSQCSVQPFAFYFSFPTTHSNSF